MDHGYLQPGMGQAAQAAIGQNTGYATELEMMSMQQAKQRDVAMKMQAGNQPRQPGLMDGLRAGHDLLDRLNAALNGLEERILPVLSGESPNGVGLQGNPQQSPEPPAIEEVVRLLLRLQGTTSLVEQITSRVRL